MAEILGELELNQTQYITLEELAFLAEKYHVLTKPSIIASRLKDSGWLLPTGQRGVWEFASASMAGSYSKNDPLKDVKAFLLLNASLNCYVCLHTAAWALGLADRVPLHKELAFSQPPRKRIPAGIKVYKYHPVIELKHVKDVPCLAPESILVQIASKPDIVDSWESVMEWLPDVVYESKVEMILAEIDERTDSVKRRTGYFLQGMYPEASNAIFDVIQKPASKIRFGSRKQAVRNDEKWKISDTALPFSPKEMERVK